jgi:hypothetical protein
MAGRSCEGGAIVLLTRRKGETKGEKEKGRKKGESGDESPHSKDRRHRFLGSSWRRFTPGGVVGYK